MSYNKHTWATGNVVGAVDLNRIENGIADADIDVDEIRGWGIQEAQLFSETVTTTDQGGMNRGTLAYSQTIDADTIIVTFNGTDYTCSRIDVFGAYFYGGFTEQGPDFSVFPFAIQSSGSSNVIFTESSGTYTVAVSASIIAVSDNFSTAVEISAEPLLATVPTPYTVTIGTTTLREVFDALASGKIPVAKHNDSMQNTPRYIEIFLYARTYNLTANSILLSNGALTVKNYTAANANSPIYEDEAK